MIPPGWDSGQPILYSSQHIVCCTFTLFGGGKQCWVMCLFCSRLSPLGVVFCFLPMSLDSENQPFIWTKRNNFRGLLTKKKTKHQPLGSRFNRLTPNCSHFLRDEKKKCFPCWDVCSCVALDNVNHAIYLSTQNQPTFCFIYIFHKQNKRSVRVSKFTNHASQQI